MALRQSEALNAVKAFTVVSDHAHIFGCDMKPIADSFQWTMDRLAEALPEPAIRQILKNAVALCGFDDAL